MASTIKVDNVQNQPGTNIVSKCGTDVTLGASGDTVALAAGASQTGFGRTGTVDWITTPKVTGDSPITAVTGEGYFLNTTAGTITINLPAGAAGSIVSMADYAATWQTNNVTVAANGSEKIGGVAEDATLNTEGQSVTFVYVDSVQGWVNTMDSTSNVRGIPPFIQATGGTPTQSGDYEIRTFTGPGTFCVTSLSPSAPENAVDWVVVASGGGVTGNGPGSNATAGAGAGGFRESPGTATGSYSVSPLAGGSAVTVSVTGYAIVVGGGGTAGTGGGPAGSMGGNGNVSSFSSYTSTGGGGGAGDQTPVGSPGANGIPGGSGGGGGGGYGCSPGGTGNDPVVAPAQGFPGGNSPAPPDGMGGGGGGATVAGGNSVPAAGTGGAGATTSITGGATIYSGGGGGGGNAPAPAGGTAGPGGGGTGGASCAQGIAGTVNTGGGGGGTGGSANTAGAAGGSGVVILRYKFQ